MNKFDKFPISIEHFLIIFINSFTEPLIHTIIKLLIDNNDTIH